MKLTWKQRARTAELRVRELEEELCDAHELAESCSCGSYIHCWAFTNRAGTKVELFRGACDLCKKVLARREGIVIENEQ